MQVVYLFRRFATQINPKTNLNKLGNLKINNKTIKSLKQTRKNILNKARKIIKSSKLNSKKNYKSIRKI
jgi:hypothetical protein